MPFTSKVSMLEETHATTALMLLLREGPIRKTVLYSFIGTNTAPVQKRLDEFKRDGLITIESDPTHHSAFIIELTAKGRRVAEHLAKIEDILSEGG